MLFNKFVGVIHEGREDAMGRYLDGDEELSQDVEQTPGVDDAAAGAEEEMPPAEEELPPEEIPPEEAPPPGDEFAPPGPPEMIDPAISETQKEINLLDLFLTMKQNVQQLQDLFDLCDFTEIQPDHFKELAFLEDGIDELHRKVVMYITDNYQYESYEKSLYIYLLLRSELTEVTQRFNNMMIEVKKERDDK